MNQKPNKGFIWIPVLIASLVIVLGGAGYFGFNQYRHYQNRKIAEAQRAKEFQELTARQQTEIDQLKEAEKKRQDARRLSNLEKELDAIFGTETKLQEQQSGDLASVIKKWRPRVAYISCKIVFDGNNLGEQSGSGYIFGTDRQNGDIILLTNYHVIDIAIHNLFGEPMGITTLPTSCDIKLAGDSQFITVANENEESPFGTFKEKDFALVTIKYPTPYMKQAVKNLWDGRCSKKAELGEKIVVLGYPGIGDQDDVTVTDGIISGYDGDYYITSAKVEHGNSGGIAVSLKNDCYLGIPTFVQKGSLESLARILNINIIFPYR